MPFKSEAQRRYLWANEPEVARKFAKKTPKGKKLPKKVKKKKKKKKGKKKTSKKKKKKKTLKNDIDMAVDEVLRVLVENNDGEYTRMLLNRKLG